MSEPYKVRLILEMEDDAASYLRLDTTLPFAPQAGVLIRLKDNNEARWWDEVTIQNVEWLVAADRFECLCTACVCSDKEANEIVEFFRSKGWKYL